MEKYTRLEQFDQELVKLENQRREIEAARRAFAELKPDQQLAIALHKTLCHSNHIDGCGWEYEMVKGGAHDWNQQTHKLYLKAAQDSLQLCARELKSEFGARISNPANDSKFIIELLETIRGY